MRKPLFLFLIFIQILGISQEADTNYLKELALHWAPIHYQSIRSADGIFNDNSLNGKSDSLSAMNFDGDWNATNNWENLTSHPADPVLYYYVATTSTHYFITYGYFHARDWTKLNIFHLAQHENDLEGALFVIEKDTTKWGKLLIGYSIFHYSIQKYKYVDQIEFRSNIFKDGITEELHPVSYQQPRGHGVKLQPSFHNPKKPYCRYTPDTLAFPTTNDKPYRLIDLNSKDQLIQQIGNEKFFNPDETIKGSHGEGANPPWLWYDRKDKKKNPDLQLFTDPANYVLIDCKMTKTFSTEYTYHPLLDTNRE